MGDNRVETGVDDLIRLLQDGEKHILEDVAKSLDISINTVQLWVDFLVEEKVVGIEYSFTKPSIYLIKQKQEDQNEDLNYFKEEFFKACREKKIPEEQLDIYWRNHLKEILSQVKSSFVSKAQQRNIPDVELQWKKYIQKVMAT